MRKAELLGKKLVEMMVLRKAEKKVALLDERLERQSVGKMVEQKAVQKDF